VPDVRRPVLVGLFAALLASGPLVASVRAADAGDIQGTVRANPLSATLALSGSRVEQGETFTGAGTVANEGAVSLTDVEVAIAADSGLTLVEGSPTRRVGDLPAGGRVDVEWTLCGSEPGIYLVTLHARGTLAGEQLSADSATRVIEVTSGYGVCGGFQFSGFFPPVDNPPTINAVNGGRAVPVKFSLGGDQGLDIFATGYPVSVRVSCETGLPVDAVEETRAASASGLTYDPATDRYTYVWKTDRAWRGTCRQFILRLSDGSIHRANFKFS
jgi:hypothetical protein